MTTFYVYDGTMLVREMRQNAQGQLAPTATYRQGPRGPEYRRDDTQAEGTYTPPAPRSRNSQDQVRTPARIMPYSVL